MVLTELRCGLPRSKEQDNAGPTHLADALTALDDRREIELVGDSGAWLGIAGGPTYFFLGYSGPDDTIWQAVADHPPTESTAVIIGGQPTVLSARYLVGAETARAAAVHFIKVEERLPTILWEQM